MANVTVNTKIIMRNDTKANWELANPILSKGEIGVEVDTRHIKIGDGVKAWGDLIYANVLAEDLANLGAGDMVKAIYDKNDDGKVDSADVADEAVRLKTPVNIGGVAFDGSADVVLTKVNVGLENVDNTADKDKPISDATQTVLDDLATEIGDVTTGIGDLNGAVNNIRTDLTNTQADVEDAKKAADDAIVAVNGVIADVDAIKTDITAIEGEIVDLNTRVDVVTVSGAISDAIDNAVTGLKLGTAATKDIGLDEGNVVMLEVGGKINKSLLPSLAITDTFIANSEADMLKLSTAEKGDICIRTDITKTFILSGDKADVISNWIELASPTADVSSVNGNTGDVVLTTSDINEGVNLYYTEDRVDANFVKHNSTELADSDTLLRVADMITLNGGNA